MTSFQLVSSLKWSALVEGQTNTVKIKEEKQWDAFCKTTVLHLH